MLRPIPAQNAGGIPYGEGAVLVRPEVAGHAQFVAKLAAGAAGGTPAEIVVIGDSQASITSPTRTGHRPWPLLLPELLAGTNQWLYAQGDSLTRSMTSTGTPSTAGTAGWSSSLAVGQYATAVFAGAAGVRVYWTASPTGGTLEVRDNAVGGTVLATISTAGTAGSGHYTEVALPIGYAFGANTLYVVAVGATAVLDTIAPYGFSRSCMVSNASHGGYSTNNFLNQPQLALDLVTQMAPDAVVLATATNDDIGNIEARLTSMVAQVRARTAGLVVLLNPYPSLGFSRPELPIVRKVAAATRCLLVDLSASMPTPSTGDGIHPTQAGHYEIAYLIAGALTGNPIGTAYAAAGSAHTYVPGNLANWSTTPRTPQEALDDLSARVKALGG